jgi:hypothetical protein
VNGVIAGWSGFNWKVEQKGAPGALAGPGGNMFTRDADHVWVDNWGLHQTIKKGVDGKWRCAEVELDQELGYGTYLMRAIGPTDDLDPHVVWSPMFLWQNVQGGEGMGDGRKELDFEHSRWSIPGDKTSSQFVLAPLREQKLKDWKVRYPTKDLLVEVDMDGVQVAPHTHVLRFFKDSLQFATFDGLWTLETIANVPAGNLIASYTYEHTSSIPVPVPGDQLHVRANLWLTYLDGVNNVPDKGPSNGKDVHIVLNGFEFSATDVQLPGLPTVHVNIVPNRILRGN